MSRGRLIVVGGGHAGVEAAAAAVGVAALPKGARFEAEGVLVLDA